MSRAGSSGIKPHYLAKKGGQWRPVSLLDLLVFVYHAYMMCDNPEVGWNDANRTFEQFMARVARKSLLDPTLIESGLYGANMADEMGKFWHPEGHSFQEWSKRFLKPGESYDTRYGYIKKVKRD